MRGIPTSCKFDCAVFILKPRLEAVFFLFSFLWFYFLNYFVFSLLLPKS